MKKSLKQIALVFLAIVMTVSSSMFLFSCGKTGNGATTQPTIPGISSTSGTTGTSSTTEATNATTSGTVTPPVNPPVNDGSYINPLTGLKTSYSGGDTNKPIAVIVDNVRAAYAHQTGLTQADVLYETLVAPGITRFTMLISDYNDLDPICNIRSAYVEHLDIIGSHNAILIAHDGEGADFESIAASRLGGGWDETLGKKTYGYINSMKDIAFTAEGGERYGTIKYYKDDPNYRKDIGYDTLITSPAIMAILRTGSSLFNQSKASSTGAVKGFTFVAADTNKVMDGKVAQNVKLTFTMDNGTGTKNVSYVYDAELDMYRRSQDGEAHVDSQTKEQLAFTNVITLFTDVSGANNVVSTKVTGEGTGHYFYGGKVVDITWSKSAWDAELILKDTNGNVLELARGTTYIGYLDNTSPNTTVQFN